MKEATILIKWENPQDLQKKLQQIRVDLDRGVIEFESKSVRFRVLAKDELPIFKDETNR